MNRLYYKNYRSLKSLETSGIKCPITERTFHDDTHPHTHTHAHTHTHTHTHIYIRNKRENDDHPKTGVGKHLITKLFAKQTLIILLVFGDKYF